MFYTPPGLLRRSQNEDEVKTASTSHRLLDFLGMHPQLKKYWEGTWWSGPGQVKDVGIESLIPEILKCHWDRKNKNNKEKISPKQIPNFKNIQVPNSN